MITLPARMDAEEMEGRASSLSEEEGERTVVVPLRFCVVEAIQGVVVGWVSFKGIGELGVVMVSIICGALTNRGVT